MRIIYQILSYNCILSYRIQHVPCKLFLRDHSIYFEASSCTNAKFWPIHSFPDNLDQLLRFNISVTNEDVKQDFICPNPIHSNEILFSVRLAEYESNYLGETRIRLFERKLVDNRENQWIPTIRTIQLHEQFILWRVRINSIVISIDCDINRYQFYCVQFWTMKARSFGIKGLFLLTLIFRTLSTIKEYLLIFYINFCTQYVFL